MKGNFLRAMEMFSEERAFRWRLFCEGIFVGAFAGVIISIFRFLLEEGENIRPVIYEYLRTTGPVAILLWVLILVLLAYILQKIVFYEPMSTGSGIPQIKGILLGRMQMNWLRVIIAKLLGGILAIGAGLSLGREGPSVQLGACTGQGMMEIRGTGYSEGRFLVIAGAGAGLAAAFNAPLAGVMFCLEELTKNFSPLGLMATIAASVTATAVSRIFFGRELVFNLGDIPVVPLSDFGILILLGIFVGALGQLFNKALVFSLDSYEKWGNRDFRKPLLPLIISLPIGFYLPEIMGGGNRLVDSLVVTDYGLGILLVFMVGKFLFTMVSFGSGVPGGIFLPMLVMGALSGDVFVEIITKLNHMNSNIEASFIVFAMAAYFSSVVRAPITASILIMEMTGSFQHMLALIVVSMTASLVAELLRGEPVYDMLLARSFRNDNDFVEAVNHHRVVAEIAINEQSTLDGVKIAEISWPPNTIIIKVKRGEAEYVPDGSLMLKSGDFIYMYADDINVKTIENLASGENF